MPDLLLFPAPTRTVQTSPGSPPQALSDADAREAALDIQRSWIVEAPAGSGKTGLLIQRFLKLLAYADIHRPGEVLVLTFTRKADGELRTRVLEQLTAASEDRALPASASSFDRKTRELAQAVLSRDRLRQWRLLDTPAQLNVRTIDSFCAELAAAMPLLSSAGRHQPVDDAFPLYQGAAERTLRQLGGPDSVLNDALRTLLLHRDAQVTDCLRLLTDMLAQREQWSELVPLHETNLTDAYLDAVVRRRLEDTLKHIATEALRRAANALGPEILNELCRFAVRLSTEPGYKDNLNPLACCSGLDGLLSVGADFLPHWKAILSLLLTADGDWRKKPSSNHLKLEIQRPDIQWLEQCILALKRREALDHPNLREILVAVRDLPPAQYPGDQWHVVKALCRILSRALTELREVFAQRNQCDFTEIALTARALLRPDPSSLGLLTPDLLNTPVAALNHLLVDEMQDTSSGQYQLLEAVTASWDGASQTVFLVGDPKQSIYAFRQARVERFLRTVDTGRLGELPLSPLRLTANFRSQAGLVDAFNATFERIFPTPEEVPAGPGTASEEIAKVPFTAATAVRSAAVAPALCWHALEKPSTGTHPLTPALTPPHTPDQPHQIRSIIENFLAAWPHRPVPAGEHPGSPKIAVLARNRAHLAPVIAEFHVDRGHGPLPFRAVDVEPLRERREVLDLLALTRALLRPADRIAWLAVLRSPVCGLALADLLALTGEGPGADRDATVPHLVATRFHQLSAPGQTLLHKVWPILQSALDTLGATPLSLHVERTWRSLGADVPFRPDQRTNCFRFFDLLRKLEAGPDPPSLSLLHRNLQKLYAEPTLADTPVELMTIHKAKGLEWDLVLVPSLERGSGRNAGSLLKWLELDNPTTEGDLLLAPIQDKGAEASSLFKWLSAGERRREIAEAQRLLYVACTRAREELHLFATVETKADGSLCSPQAKASLLNAAWPAAQPILQHEINNHPRSAEGIPIAAQPQPASLSLAAAAGLEIVPRPEKAPPPPTRGTIARLPDDFDPLARFRDQEHPTFLYTPAGDLRQAHPFTRPEGSFASRAFGNAVHRFLQLLSTKLTEGQSPQTLSGEVAGWLPRLTAVFRSEGLPSAAAAAQAQRALSALRSTLAHPEGAWVLGPHSQARSEAALPSLKPATTGLRADRIFLAGSRPFSGPEDSHLWILDYKTAEPGGRNREAFLVEQKAKSLPQMQAYAEAATAAGVHAGEVILALYFPLLPALFYWPANGS